MKRIVCLLLVALIVVTGCNKVKQLANINVDIPYNTTVSIPVGLDTVAEIPGKGISVPFPSVPIATNSKEYIAQYHTSSDKVLAVTLKELMLQVSAPPDANFNFLDSVQVFVSAQALPEVLVAYKYNIAKGQVLVSLDMMNVNLKPYFLQDTMYVRLNAHINAIPAEGTQMNVTSIFHLLANPLY